MESTALLPKYLQVKNYILGKINSGEYKKGKKLPSERELSEKFGISRMTARYALTELIKEGVAYRKGTYGTIVSSTKSKKSTAKLESFTSFARSQGYKDIRAEVIIKEKKEADAYVSEKLEISLGTPYYHMIRVRFCENEPKAVEENFINCRFIPDFETYTFEHDSLWEILNRNKNSAPAGARVQVEMIYLDKSISRHLNVNSGSPAFKAETRTYNKDNELIECSLSYYPGDTYVFSYEVDMT